MVSVPEARDTPGTRQIELAFAVFPATERAGSPDPLLVLLGGPGSSASEQLPALAETHALINRSRDVVVIDQRGTGRSAPLHCPFGTDDDLQSYMGAFLPLGPMQECRARLESVADLARYRTRDFIADLEVLRASLGVTRWNLHGGSYGTRVALQYLQRHPEAIRSAILAGVVPPAFRMPLTVGADADAALDKLASDCRADPACATAFPRFRDEVSEIVERLEVSPASVVVTHPVTSRPVTVSFSRSTFGETVRSLMYAPAGASSLPLAVHEAWGGDYRALATTALSIRRALGRNGSAGLYLAVTCAEDVARIDPAAAYDANRPTTMGMGRPRQHIEACGNWPTRSDGDEWPAPVPVPLPVLMIVGDTDPATPPYWAEAASGLLENSRLILVPQGGHHFSGMQGHECIDQIQAAFVDRPEPTALDAACVASMRRPPFLLRR